MNLEATPKIIETRDAKPFLKWVGGKTQLLPQLESYFPAKFDRYFEPFIGGGAVFFHLWNSNKIQNETYLFDNNESLTNTYRVVRDSLGELVTLLASHQEKHNKDYYYQIRLLDRQPVHLTNIERAARIIYLNKTCYNGLYRVNSKNQFNVPMGSYKNPRILNEDMLSIASISLQNVSVRVSDFREIATLVQAGDFLYFDPPYDPVSKTASFTGYTASNFRDEDQKDLANVFKQLTDKGCYCMLSNSYTPLILELYKDFKINIVNARRSINSDANGRGFVQEIVVINY